MILEKLKKEENLIYLMILITPILDSMSYLFKQIFPNIDFTPTAFLRLIIPLILLIKLFIKNKNSRKTIIISSFLIGIYTIIHLILYKNQINTYTYGGIFSELQFIVYYTFSILVLYLIFSYRSVLKNEIIHKVLYYVLSIYTILIYLSLITSTSSTTYIEGMGYKGWFASGNFISSVLILLLFFTTYKFKDNLKRGSALLVVLLGLFMTMLLGTRTGLYGYIMCVIIYFVLEIINCFKTKKLDKKTIIILLILIIMIIPSRIFETSSTERRESLSDQVSEKIDPLTNQTINVAKDVLDMKNTIIEGKMNEKDMSLEQQKSIVDLYNYATKINLDITKRRVEQLIYHTYLYKNQSNFLYKLFGNGHLINYGELTLEMEIPLLFYNFGIIGFIFFLVPFIWITFKLIIKYLKNIKKVSIEETLCMLGIGFSFVLSIVVGYTYFFTTIALFISIIMANLYNKQY